MLRTHKSFNVVAALALLGMSACSKPTGTSTADNAGTTAAAAGDDASDTPAKVLDCNKVFSPADLAGVTSQPATLSTIPSLPGSCLFKTQDSTAQVSWDHDVERALWDDPNQRSLGKYLPIAGLGDEAFGKTNDDGAQLYIKKGNHYCSVVAGINDLKVKGDALAHQLGALCDKAFAAL